MPGPSLVRPPSRLIRWDHPVADRLRGYWACAGFGSILGELVAGNHGMAQDSLGHPLWNWGPSPFGAAWVGDGVQAKAALPDSPLLRPGRYFTLAAHFAMSGSGLYPGLIARFSAFNYGNVVYGLSFKASARTIAFGAAGSVYESTSLPAVALGAWSFAAGVNAPAGATLYLDGAAESTTAFGTPTYGAEVADIGALVDTASDSTGQFPGSIACVAMWDRPLSGPELQEFRADPWCVLRPRGWSAILAAAIPTTPAFRPAWASRPSPVLGGGVC